MEFVPLGYLFEIILAVPASQPPVERVFAIYLFIYSSIHISNQNQSLKYTNKQCGLNGKHRDNATYVPPQWKIHKYKDSNNHTCTHKTYNLPKIAYDRSVILTAILNCFRFRARTVEAGNLLHSVTTRTGKE